MCAHCGIVPEGRFFQVVADDSDLRVSSATLSGALRNVRVIILFICSAGRFDEHPMASTTVGLAKELLDGGCSAVIASPWPVDSRVPSHWLPAFLEAWANGRAVIRCELRCQQSGDKSDGRFSGILLSHDGLWRSLGYATRS